MKLSDQDVEILLRAVEDLHNYKDFYDTKGVIKVKPFEDLVSNLIKESVDGKEVANVEPIDVPS